MPVFNQTPSPLIYLIVEAISSSIDDNLTKLLDTHSWGGIKVNENMQTSIEKILRFDPPKNGQTKGITFARDYKVEEVLKRI